MDKAELEKFEQLKMLSETAGGIYLIDTTRKVCRDIINQISNGYTDLSEIELRSKCAKLNANLSLYQLMTGISEQIEAIKEVLGENKEEEKK